MTGPANRGLGGPMALPIGASATARLVLLHTARDMAAKAVDRLYGFFSLRQPPARLFAMICLSNALSARPLICSPSV